MSFELWGFGGEFHLNFPLRSFGYLFIGIYILVLLAIILSQSDLGSILGKLRAPRERNLFLLLGLAQVLLTQLFIIRLELPGFDPLVADSQDQFVISFALFAALPWMIAGGLFGARHAILLAAVGGLLFSGTESQGVISSFHFAFVAGIFSWTMRNNFNDLIGKALRNPIVTGLIVGLLSGLLKSTELLALYEGDAIQGINYLLGNLGEIIVFSVLPLIVAGTASTIVQWQSRDRWHNPRWLTPGPYRRSLAGQILSVFLVLGVVASSILLVGDWLLAQTSAEELVEIQAQQTATDSASGIPYFFQTGRSLVRQHATEISVAIGDPEQLGTFLERQLTLVDFFDQVIIYDIEKSIIMTSSETQSNVPMNNELELSLDVALSGLPDEAVVPPAEGGQSARLVFLTPIFSVADGSLIGAYSGWTILEGNPFLLPTVDRLKNFSLGTGFVTEGRGRIIIHPDPGMIMRLSEVDIASGEGVVRGFDIQGQPHISYVHPVDGHAWNVIITIPQLTVTGLALRLGLRLITMILIIGGVVLGVIYTIGRRLTQPLEHMVEVAESIARGNLEKSVPNGGEDEIGRLSVSFERMRSSLQSRLNEMDLLLAVSQRVASSLDLNQVLPPIMDGIRGLTNANLVRLLIAPERPRFLTPVEAYESGNDPGGWTSLDKQILELSQEKGRFVLENPARAQAVFNLAQLSVGISSLASFPILNEDQFVGCIWLGHQSPHAYSENETNLISIITSNLGVAVANARLYHSGEDERKRLGAMLEAIPDAVIVTNAHGVISLANPAAQVVLNVPVEEAVGRSISEVVVVDDIQEMLTQSDLTSPTREIHLADGQVFFISVSEIQEGETPSSGRISVLWDISHFKKLDTLKSEFVSTVSHDLKMPLTLMKGYVTMLSMVGSMNDQQKEYLRKITESSDQMESLVDNVLDLSRIEAGLGLKLEKVDVGSIVMEVVDSYKPQAANRQVSIEGSVDQKMTLIEIDRTLIRQALANLVDNAVNFTPAHGKISVRAIQLDGIQRISVEDTGAGIAPTDQARLFEKFYRIQSMDSADSLGSGLGLAIVKSIVEQHGGRVHVESRLGAGSTFTIDLPIRSPRVGLQEGPRRGKP
jgi:PAS domain S-box-containing protein